MSEEIQTRVQWGAAAVAWNEGKPLTEKQKKEFLLSLPEETREAARKQLYLPSPREEFRQLLRGLAWAQRERKQDVAIVVGDITHLISDGKPTDHLQVAHASLAASARVGAREARHHLLALAFATRRSYRDVEWIRGALLSAPSTGLIRDVVRAHWPKAFEGVPSEDQYTAVHRWITAEVSQGLVAKKLTEKCTDLARRAKLIEKPAKAKVEKMPQDQIFRAVAGTMVEYGESAVLALTELASQLEKVLQVERTSRGEAARAEGLARRDAKRQRVRVETEPPTYEDETELDLLSSKSTG